MKRRMWWVVGAVVVAAALAGVWAWQAMPRLQTPEDATLQYLRALESGDSRQIEATAIDISPASLEAFAGASALIEDAELGVVTLGADNETATAEVSFALDGEQTVAEISLTSVDGRFVVDSSGLGTVVFASAIGSFVSVGDATVPVDEEIALVPAVYTFAAAPTALLDAKEVRAVLPSNEQQVALDAAIRPEATVVAQAQLDEHLSACTETAAAAPEECGIQIPWGTEFQSAAEFRYRVEQLPVIVLTADGGFSAEDGVLTATVAGIGLDGEQREATYRTESWSVRGEVTFTETGLALSPW